MGTEIVGLLLFLIITVFTPVIFNRLIKNIALAFILSVVSVLCFLQALNLIYTGELNIMTMYQLYFTGGITAVASFIVGLFTYIGRLRAKK